MTAKTFDVVGLGEYSLDRLCLLPRHPELGEKVEASVMETRGGGQIATAMAACAMLGLRTRYLGPVSDDEAGQQTLDELDEIGVDTTVAHFLHGVPTREAVVLVDQRTGERTVLGHRDERFVLSGAKLNLEAALSARVLHLDASQPEAALHCARKAQGEGVLVSVDLDTVGPAVDELFGLSDLCIVPARFALELTAAAEPAAALRRLCSRSRGLVVVTAGAEGALTLAGDAVVRVPAFPVGVLDTTGCGDVFHAAAIVALLRGLPPRELLRFANAAAGLASRALGARGSLPTLSEVQALLRS
jgi:sulfofructose kinase